MSFKSDEVYFYLHVFLRSSGGVFLQIFPIIIYFSAVINIFYYWGLMQMVVSGIAWLMQFTMETTAIESLNAACNIFVGMVCLI